MLVQQNHAAGGANGSIMVGSLCACVLLARSLPSGSFCSCPNGLGVKLLISYFPKEYFTNMVRIFIPKVETLALSS
jgi:hypothetical protein